jgi:DNA modification methylase
MEMKLVSVDDIVIESRFRKIFIDIDIMTLAESIVRLGLFHAPVVQNDGKTLVIGERRLRAIKMIYEEGVQNAVTEELCHTFAYDGVEIEKGMVPVVLMEDLLSHEYKEAEVEENARRVNLTWKEQAAAIAELHELRSAQAEREGRTQQLGQTAEEIKGDHSVGFARTQLNSAILLSKYMDDPEVSGASTKEEALKVIDRKLRKAKDEVLAREALASGKIKHDIRCGSIFDELPKIKEGSIDCIICDPPYGVDADKFKNQKAVKHSYRDDASYSDSIYELLAVDGQRITKKEAHIFIFLDVNRYQHIKAIFEKAGWEVWKTPIFWFKGVNVGVAPQPDYGPRRCYEAILFANKGKKKVRALGADILDISHDRTVERAAHKPPALYEELLRWSCQPGDTAIDPCCGTGPIFPAAKKLFIKAIGIEIDEEAIGIALKRMEGGDE